MYRFGALKCWTVECLCRKPLICLAFWGSKCFEPAINKGPQGKKPVYFYSPQRLGLRPSKLGFLSTDISFHSRSVKSFLRIQVCPHFPEGGGTGITCIPDAWVHNIFTPNLFPSTEGICPILNIKTWKFWFIFTRFVITSPSISGFCGHWIYLISGSNLSLFWAMPLKWH